MGTDKAKQPEKSYVWYCTECGGKNVEIKIWTDPNDENNIVGNDSLDNGDCWCNDCQEHNRLEMCEADIYPRKLEEIKMEKEEAS